jgi:hypothetical protein
VVCWFWEQGTLSVVIDLYRLISPKSCFSLQTRVLFYCTLNYYWIFLLLYFLFLTPGKKEAFDARKKALFGNDALSRSQTSTEPFNNEMTIHHGCN